MKDPAPRRLDEATLEGRTIEGEGLSLRRCRIRGGTLDLRGCDLRGAEISGVHVRSLEGCDLRGARLEDNDLRGANLRGARAASTTLRDNLLEGADASGADFRGADGPTPTGARTGPDWPALGVAGGTLLIGALLLRALVPPEAPPAPSPAAQGAEQRERARRGLAELRDAVRACHERRTQQGFPRWPSLMEVQQNRADGEALVRGGLPANPLTRSEGRVLPYCDPAPNQPALSGVDADWFYCEESGRLFAAAGESGEGTLNW